jgi:16S rRNA (uracil1498-N3)-methyltransferase
MTRRRWIADEVAGDQASLVGENAYHLARVLRAKVGQQFDVVAAGRVRHGQVTAISDQRVELELAEDVLSADPRVEITLLISIFKFERMEWALEKATELGVARLVPVIAQRSEKHLALAAGKRVERWRRIVQQSAQQARRASVPEVGEPIPLDQALAGADQGIVLAESEQDAFLKQVLTELKSSSSVRLAIGPEGGWTGTELKAFQNAGWRSASLGNSILRAETAAIAALAVVFSELT